MRVGKFFGVGFHAGRVVGEMRAGQLHVDGDSDHSAQNQRQVPHLLMPRADHLLDLGRLS